MHSEHGKQGKVPKQGLGAKESRSKARTRMICAGIAVVGLLTAISLAVLQSRSFKNKNNAPPQVSFLENEAVRVMDIPVTLAEFMLYTVGIKTPYDETYGEAYWSAYSYNAQGEVETNETIVKEEIAESIRLVKVLCAAGEEYGITISDEEGKALDASARTYYQSLAENGVDSGFLTSAIVERYVREQYLSEKVYNHIRDRNGDVGDENEISDAVVEEIAGLLSKYDGDYWYASNINWEVMNQFRFYEEFTPDDEDLAGALDYLLNKDNED